MKKALMTAHVAYAIEQFNIPNIKLLQTLGYEVQVACNFDDRSSLSEEKVALLKARLDKMGVVYHNIPFQRSPLKTQNLKAYRQLKALIDKQDFQLIHCHTPVGGIITRLAGAKSRKKGTRLIYTAHGFHFFKGASKINWLLYFTAEWLCSFFTDTLITINKEDFHNGETLLHAKKVCYVPGVGVDCAAFFGTREKRQELLSELAVGEDSVLLLSVGELSKRKNHKTAIEALSLLDNDKTHLIIAGIGEKQQELSSLAKELGVEKRVHLLGFRRDIAELMKSSDIFIFPSLQEGLPVAVMEAMACGMAVVCSDIRGNVDLIDGSCGILCDARDSKAFAEAVKSLTENEEKRKELSQKALSQSKKYDIDIIQQYMTDIYR